MENYHILGNKIHSNLNDMKKVDTNVEDILSDDEYLDTQPSIDATTEMFTKIFSVFPRKYLTKMIHSYQDYDDDELESRKSEYKDTN